jgi:hypothetical protein
MSTAPVRARIALAVSPFGVITVDEHKDPPFRTRSSQRLASCSGNTESRSYEGRIARRDYLDNPRSHFACLPGHHLYDSA